MASGAQQSAEHSAAERRSRLKARVFPLGREPCDDLTATTTAAERIEMVARITADLWARSGTVIPVYKRHEIPVARVPLDRQEV